MKLLRVKSNVVKRVPDSHVHTNTAMEERRDKAEAKALRRFKRNFNK